MKKLIVLASATVFCLSGMAALPGNITSDAGGERVNCKKISIGTKRARITLPDGEKKVMLIDQLESYQVDGAAFEKKELYSNGKPTGKTAFMQLLKTRNGLSLYKNMVLDPEIAAADKRRIEYFVYQGDKLYLDVTPKVLPNAVTFFGLKWSDR